MDKYEIIALSKDKWKGTIIPMTIRSDSYYDFEIRPFDKNGCQISMIRKPAESRSSYTGRKRFSGFTISGTLGKCGGIRRGK